MKKAVNLSFSFLFTVFLGYGLFCAPRQMAEAVKDALGMCAHNVIPSLFPFFILSGVIINSGLSEIFSRMFSWVMKPLFNINGAGASALILGLISGFPVGASTVTKLYAGGLCTKDEAERLLAFTNNTGPGFIISVIGLGVFGSVKIGLYIYLIQLVSAILTGLLFSLKRNNQNISNNKNHSFSVTAFSEVLVESIRRAVDSTLNITAFIIAFSIIIAVIKATNFLPFNDENVILSCLYGVIELTNGIKLFNFTLAKPELIFVLCVGLVCFSGISVHCQTLFEISGSGLGIKSHFLGKILCTCISVIIATFFTSFHPMELPVFSPVNTHGHSFVVEHFILLGAFLICCYYIFFRKRWKKSLK